RRNFHLQSRTRVRTIRRPVNTGPVPEAEAKAEVLGRRIGAESGAVTEPNGTTPGRSGIRRSTAVGRSGQPWGSVRRWSAESAPRRSKLRRSGDYSGPSAVPARTHPSVRRANTVPNLSPTTRRLRDRLHPPCTGGHRIGVTAGRYDAAVDTLLDGL